MGVDNTPQNGLRLAPTFVCSWQQCGWNTNKLNHSNIISKNKNSVPPPNHVTIRFTAQGTLFCWSLRDFSTVLWPLRGVIRKIGTIQRRLAWPLHKDDTLFRSGRPTGLNIYPFWAKDRSAEGRYRSFSIYGAILMSDTSRKLWGAALFIPQRSASSELISKLLGGRN